MIYGLLEALRTQVLVRGGLKFDGVARDPIFKAVLDSTLTRRGPGSQAVRGSLEQNAIFHIIVQAAPRLRAALCAKNLCDANGVPVELPNLKDVQPKKE